MTEQLLATLTTDEHGECTYTYTGEGNGVIQFLAKHGIIQSETYEVLDCIYYITNTYDLYKASAITVTPNEDTVTFSASGNYGLIFLNTDNSYRTGNYCFEFKLVDFSSDTIEVRCDNSSSSSLGRSLSILGASDGDVIRAENNGTIVNFYVKDVLRTTRSNNGTIRYGFRIPEGESITVTDMKFYPI